MLPGLVLGAVKRPSATVCAELSNHEIFEKWRVVDTAKLTGERQAEFERDRAENASWQQTCAADSGFGEAKWSGSGGLSRGLPAHLAWAGGVFLFFFSISRVS